MQVFGLEFYLDKSEPWLNLSSLAATLSVSEGLDIDKSLSRDEIDESYDNALEFAGTLNDFLSRYPNTYKLAFKDIITKEFVIIIELFKNTGSLANISYSVVGSESKILVIPFHKEEGYTLAEIAQIVITESIIIYKLQEIDVTGGFVRFSINQGYTVPFVNVHWDS